MIDVAARTMLLAALACAGTAALADEQPQDWLRRMGEAIETLNYSGTFAYVVDGKVETMSVVHRVDGDQVTERLYSRHGSPREIITTNDEVKCIFEEQRTVLIERRRDQSPLRAAVPQYTEALREHYEFVALGTAMIAGRSTRVIGIHPLDDFRYGYNLWLDEVTAIPLKSELIDEDGDTIEQILFDNIRIGEAIADRELEPDIAHDSFMWYAEDEAPAPAPVTAAQWHVRDLPPGFTMSAAEARHSSEALAEQMVFTDGLASVSVFVEDVSVDRKPIEGVHKIGSANAYSTVIYEHQIMVIGEVPAATVKLLGNSVAPATAAKAVR